MSCNRALRGSCHCGRNQYLVRLPSNATHDAQILFDTDSGHRISTAAPLSAFLRVPLEWYHSQTFAFFPDETRSTIRRTFSHPSEQQVQRYFCGFCSTPLATWSEQPRSEADYIRVTLGSLLTQDLRDLEDIGLIPDDSDADEMDIVPTPAPAAAATSETQLIGREFQSIPWFEAMIQGSRLGNMRTSKGTQQSQDGRVRVEWEITEWRADEDDAEEAEASESSATGKRKRGESGSSAVGATSL
ncbi:uncharacterized protein BCR38DRAFT_230330 [Pseudomassariella vexata]|uniref:CENP-V/GFA domain-containing protein n=1 Tax=Pseudomassariella vexata TaxID=1141098 RepID=A0A1Y2DW67_9PEZI|nr:uncharacterized protein BCR38DRAFT_230330 [Pseudomassariella vexata]ORY63542.1 hypothetical protein BCR38DRAFT_230330 [Pseudomassariella vexata]